MGFGKDHKGVMIREFASDIALGALAHDDLVLIPSGVSPTEDFRMLKAELAVIAQGLTSGQGVGLIFGICNGELTDAEVEEAIEATGPVDRNDRVAEERATRNVKILSILDSRGGAETEMVFKGEHDSPIIVTKHRWTYSDPEGWNYFIYNAGAALTTGASVSVIGTLFGLWLT